jgi:hypothetical protein
MFLGGCFEQKINVYHLYTGFPREFLASELALKIWAGLQIFVLAWLLATQYADHHNFNAV